MSARKRRRRGPIQRVWLHLVEFSSRGDRHLFMVVALPVLILFIATMRWSLPVNIDAFTNSISAHYLGTTGLPWATEHEELVTDDPEKQFSWFVEGEGGPISAYPPGAPYLAAVPYALSGSTLQPLTLYSTSYQNSNLDSSIPPIWPGSLTAALTSALAIGFLSLTYRRLGTVEQAIVGAYVAGLGTSVWSVASNELWQHGPSLMFLALASYFVVRESYLAAGLAFGFAAFSREQNALAAFVVGVGLSIIVRSAWPALKIGIGSLPGVAALLYHNHRFLGIVGVEGLDLRNVSRGFLVNLGGLILVGGGLVFVAYWFRNNRAVKGAVVLIALVGWVAITIVGYRDATAYEGIRVSVGDSAIVDLADAIVREETLLTDLGGYAWNTFQGVIGTDQGFLLWSPFLLVLLLGMRTAWQEADPRVKLFAFAGLFLLLVQYRFQVYGHGSVFTYRYPLEPLMVSAPIWFCAYVNWRPPKFILASASSVSVTLHAVGAIRG